MPVVLRDKSIYSKVSGQNTGLTNQQKLPSKQNNLCMTAKCMRQKTHDSKMYATKKRLNGDVRNTHIFSAQCQTLVCQI